MYATQYISEFNNKEGNAVKIIIQKKDGAQLENELTCMGCEVSYPNGDESKYNSIISAVAKLKFYSGINDTVTNETFLTDYYDEWRVTITVDTYKVFEGFIEPSEGGYAMKDRPYIIDVTCTDGLGLLKNIPLTTDEGNNFSGIFSLSTYILACLYRTNLDLNLRVYCNISHPDLIDRSNGDFYDMMFQVYLNHRTFLKNVTEFTSCYEALNKILGEAFTLFYWNGRWVISYRPELVNESGVNIYWSEYDTSGQIITAGMDTYDHCKIGSNKLIYPVNASQIISYQIPVREVVTKFMYNVWPEIPSNPIFERGEIIPLMSGDGFSSYTIDAWQYGRTQPSTYLPLDTSTPSKAYRYSTYNDYGVELDREIRLESEAGETLWLMSDEMPVAIGDKFEVHLDFVTETPFISPIPYPIIWCFIIPDDGGDYWWMDADGKWTQGGLQGATVSYTSANEEDWYTFNTESTVPNVAGVMKIAIEVNANAGDYAKFKDFKFTYTPMVAGGYIPVKGDKWTTSQGFNIKDIQENEVSIGDCTMRMVQGALLKSNGALLDPAWYRYGTTEQMGYKELLNIGRFQHYRRRFKKISGEFKGVLQASENNQIDFSPLSFHRHFTFYDDSQLKRYLLVPPLTIDYVSATFNGIFTECYMNGEDKTYGDNRTFAYIF